MIRARAALALVVATGCATAHDRADTRARDAGAEDGRVDAGDAAAPLDPRTFEAMRNLAECHLGLRCASRLEEGYGRLLQRWCHPSIGVHDLEPVESGRLRFDPEAAARCLASYDASCVWTGAYEQPASECAGVYTGAVPDGGSCRHSVECSGAESYCRTEEACPGTCAPLDDRGDPCVGASCRSPFICRSTADGSHTCQGQIEGETCTTSDDCAFALLCDESFVCATKGGEGDACALDGRLDPFDGYGDCDERLACFDTGDGMPRCTDPLSIGVGGPCFVSILGTCPDPLICAVDEARISFGECVIGAPIGAPCEPTAPCKLGSECIDGVCRETIGPGGACDSERVCVESHACRSGRCEPLPVLGEPCAWSDRCFTGACVDGTCSELPVGAACSSAFECATYCSSTGVCAEFVPSGGECFASGGRCARDHGCRRDASDTYRCLPNC